MLSLDLAPYPTPLLRHVSLSQSFSVSSTRQSSLLTGEGGGGGREKEPNHTTARKPGPL
jgi:hypothetical protein